MTSVFSWQNSISLCPASFCTPRANLPVTPGVSWLPSVAFQSPIMKRTSFLSISSRRSCRSSYNHSTSASSALLVGYRLGLLWYCVVCLGNEQRSFCRFWDCIQVLHFRLFCWLCWLLHFFQGIPAYAFHTLVKSLSSRISLSRCVILNLAWKVLHLHASNIPVCPPVK